MTVSVHSHSSSHTFDHEGSLLQVESLGVHEEIKKVAKPSSPCEAHPMLMPEP
jgi:hypothetical protein